MRVDFSRADQVVLTGLKDGAYTAACLLVGRGERVLFRRAYGRLSRNEEAPRANEQTRFDLDTLTEPLVTGMLALRAMEAGKLCLNDTLDTFLHAPEDKKDITIAQLLCHTSGMRPCLPLQEMAQQPQDAARVILDQPLEAEPGTKMLYGGNGHMLLGQLLECLYGMELSELAVQEVFWPLKMQRAGYLPKDGNIAFADENGNVFDDNARFLGGVSGHAGVFGSMDDLALWMQLLAADGVLPDGSRYLSKASVSLVKKQWFPDRSLCFAFPGATGFTGDLFPAQTIGHATATGCSVALDPETGVYTVFLTNAVSAGESGYGIHRLRRLLHNAVYAAV